MVVCLVMDGLLLTKHVNTLRPYRDDSNGGCNGSLRREKEESRKRSATEETELVSTMRRASGLLFSSQLSRLPHVQHLGFYLHRPFGLAPALPLASLA
jgi:hypothetical protein